MPHLFEVGKDYDTRGRDRMQVIWADRNVDRMVAINNDRNVTVLYTCDGKVYGTTIPSPYDLMRQPKVAWVNLMMSKGGALYLGAVCDTLEECRAKFDPKGSAINGTRLVGRYRLEEGHYDDPDF